MKLHSLHIDGFGGFADRRFGPFEQPVTVFYGPNEAGKSNVARVRTTGAVRVSGRPQQEQPLSTTGPVAGWEEESP